MATKSAPTVVKNYSSVLGHIVRQRPGTKYAPEVEQGHICILFAYVAGWSEDFNPKPVYMNGRQVDWETDRRDYKLTVYLGDEDKRVPGDFKGPRGDVVIGFENHREVVKFCQDFAQWLHHSPEKKGRFKDPQEMAALFDKIAEGIKADLLP